MILPARFTFIIERVEEKHVFALENGLTTYFFMTSYLVTIATDHH